MASVTYLVRGMSCDHCVHAVTAELAAIDGVTAVDIEVVKQGASKVAVTSDDPLDERAVAAAVDEAGYEFAGVSG